MKAFTKYKYGGPEVLQLEEIETPKITEDQVLIKVMANSANPADWHIMRGTPKFLRMMVGLFKPSKKYRVLGADFAGIVQQVGSKVNDLKKGDKVFGESSRGGAFAEFVAVANSACAKMADNINFAEMAAVPIAGLTALQSLRDHGVLKAGEKVLINGSSGGVGHYAVQIAKILGAEITAVCSAKNEAFVKSIGADHVIAYDQTDIYSHNFQYDLVVDNNGNLRLKDYKRLGKRGVMVGMTSFRHLMGLMLKKNFTSYSLKSFTAEPKKADLEWLTAHFETGQLKSSIEKTFTYTDIPEAIGYIEDMRTRGKVVMSWE